tara:strand:- start:1514 stop:2131 length:618 start_codon:yes stop_codon:yes gene_type:complete
MLKDYTDSLVKAFNTISEENIDQLYEEIINRIDGSSLVHVIGNGGSAANSSHIVGDYNKTFSLLNIKLKFVNNLDNICYLTALANDIDFTEVYSSLVGTHINSNDLIVFLSGSGNSLNLIKCANKAARFGIKLSSITGYNGGKLKDIVDIPIHIDYPDMEIAEDCQLIIFHYLKQKLVNQLSKKDPYASAVMTKYSKRVIEDLIA